ncbi:putative PTS system IIA component [Pantoea stewartii subsp. stewartii DC283]|uniref:Putative PTS system IIA component n=1 Tax=Pantoea stewartii subsp. stewartii DC283 TaxID=660596 RepID=H3RH63_PANSE|nr:putative PTS system IIA component [Pantoea stewartii subsp. stewartii DC283]
MANLTQWLNAEKIQYIERVSDWKEAIQVTGNPLCREGAISQDYIDTIVRLKEETGPYFVIAPRIAMPHARPEQGAKKLGLSVVKLATPVNFDADENDPVDILFMFSAPDSNSHIEMISQLAEVLTTRTSCNAFITHKASRNCARFCWQTTLSVNNFK